MLLLPLALVLGLSLGLGLALFKERNFVRRDGRAARLPEKIGWYA